MLTLFKKKNTAALVFLYIFTFLWASAIALPLYIQSSYLEQFVPVSRVGLYLTAATAITLVAITFFPYFIKRYGNYPTSVTILSLLTVSEFALAFAGNAGVALVFFITYYLCWSLLLINIDVYLEELADERHMGRIRTGFLTIFNLAVAFTPLLMGYLSQNENYARVYFVSGIILIPAFLFLLVQKRYTKKKLTEYSSRRLPELLLAIRGNRNIVKIFQVALTLRIFFSIMVLYTPIYLHQQFGFGWEQLGVMFAIMLLPFVIFELPAGGMADRYWGEKEMMVFGLLVMMISTGAIFFVTSHSFAVWTALLFLTRVGAALVESMQDVYFFKIVHRGDLDMIDLFRDLGPAGWLLGPTFAVILLQFLPVEYVFLALASIIFISLRSALTMQDTK